MLVRSEADSLPQGALKSMKETNSSLRQLIAQISEDYRSHRSDRTLPGFRAVAVHRFGVWVRGLRFRLFRGPFSIVYRVLYRYIRNHYSIELVPATRVGRRLRLGHQGGMVIGPAQIGDDCIIRHNVTVGAVSEATMNRLPILMNRVEVGCGAVILGGVVIGDDARIGPNAVVTMDVPAGAAVMAPLPRIVPLKRSIRASEGTTDNEALECASAEARQ
jgi:serine O-acetyltransferase